MNLSASSHSVIPFIHTNSHTQIKSFITFYLAYCNAVFSTISKHCCCCRIAAAKTICQLSAFIIFSFLLLLSLFLLDTVDVIATCKHPSPLPYFAFFNFLLIIGWTDSVRTCSSFVSFSNKLFFPQAAIHGCLNIYKHNFSFTNSPFQISSLFCKKRKILKIYFSTSFL